MNEKIQIVETPNNYQGKIKLIQNILEDIKNKKQSHYTCFSRYKQINTLIKSVVNTLNAVSVCSMVLTFTPVSHTVMIIALSATSVSAITSAVHSSTDIEGRVHSHNTSYLQYTDIYRDVSARLLRNGMSSQDLDNLLSEINSRMGLIEDQSLPVKIVKM